MAQTKRTTKSETTPSSLRITLIKSPLGRKPGQLETAHALGLRKVRDAVMHRDDATIRGMIRRVAHLVKVEEVR